LVRMASTTTEVLLKYDIRKWLLNKYIQFGFLLYQVLLFQGFHDITGIISNWWIYVLREQ
jgi:hypothetical protein